MIRIGVIGYGYWGPNIVRNFHTHENSEVAMVADKNPKTQERLRKAHPGMAFTTDENDILTSPNIDLVAVVTPVWTHYDLAKKALEILVTPLMCAGSIPKMSCRSLPT